MKPKIENLILLMIFVFFMFVAVNTGIAADKISLNPMVSVEGEDAAQQGKILIKPTLSASSRLDSNYYKTEKDERQVYTYVVQPGIQMGYKTPKSMMSLIYSLNANFYDDDDDIPAGEISADENDFWGHTLDFSAQTTPFSKLTLELNERFDKTRDQSETDRFALDEKKDKYAINRITPGLLYRFNDRFSTGLKYRNTIISYTGGSTQDYIEHRGIFDLIYHFSPTSSLDLEYHRWKRNYDVGDTSDYVSDRIKLIFRKQAKIFGFEAGAGFHNRDFEDKAQDDNDAFSYHFAVSGQIAKTMAKLSFEEDFNDEGISSSFYKSRKADFSLNRTFLEKILAKANGYYQINEYENLDRDDDVFGFSASIGYRFKKWLTLTLSTGYDDKDSNIDENDYDNKYVMLKLDSFYDFGKRN